MEKDDLKWDFSALSFTGDDDPRLEEDIQEFVKHTTTFVDKWVGRTDYLEEVDSLSEALTDYEAWAEQSAEPASYYYAWLRQSQAQDNPVVKALYNRLDKTYREHIKDIQFFNLNLAKIPKQKQQLFLNDPKVTKYKHYLQRVFAEAEHLLTEAEEKILIMMAPTSLQKWVEMTQEFLNKETVRWVNKNGEETEISFNELIDLISNVDQQTRDEAAAKLNEIFRKHIHTGEAELNSVLGHKQITDQLRRFDRPDKARHLSDDISTGVVDVMLETVANNFDIARRFYALRAKLMGKDQLQYHERNVPIDEVEVEYSYDQAMDLVQSTFEELDPEFGQIAEKFRNGFVDVYPSKGKRGGAFCTSGSLRLPTYIMLNHQGKLRDVLTIAHEFGHGVNFELMRKNLHALDFDTSLATAEVASTFMEDFVLQRLLTEADDSTKLAILVQRLGDDVSTIFRQVACYRFEQALHQAYREEHFLSSDRIGQIFKENMEAYMGDAVEQSPGAENWWLYWSHIRSYFYVYSYASGLLISKAMQAKVNEDRAAVGQVKQFLADGMSKSPLESFAAMDIDITKKTFWEKGLGEISSLLEEVEALAGKLGKL